MYLVEKENLGKDAFGRLFGLNRGAIASYIEGKAKPKLETMQKISERYTLSLDDLVGKNLYDFQKGGRDLIKKGGVPKKKDSMRDLLLHEEHPASLTSEAWPDREAILLRQTNKLFEQTNKLFEQTNKLLCDKIAFLEDQNTMLEEKLRQQQQRCDNLKTKLSAAQKKSDLIQRQSKVSQKTDAQPK